MRVGPTQFPLLWGMHVENCATFGWERIPELYVMQTPIFNAGAYGIDDPFIVIHSSAFELLDQDEQRVLLAHELGHVISGHALYRTMAEIMTFISLGALPMLAANYSASGAPGVPRVEPQVGIVIRSRGTCSGRRISPPPCVSS